MVAVTCPNCDAALSEVEQIDGWCESCGRALPPHVSAAAAKQSRLHRRHDPAAAPASTPARLWNWWGSADSGPN